MPDLEALEVAKAALSDVSHDDDPSKDLDEEGKVKTAEQLEAEADDEDGEGESEAEKESKSQRRRRLRREREQEIARKVETLQSENARLKERAKTSGKQPDPRYYNSDAEYAADLAVWKSRAGDVQAETSRLEKEYEGTQTEEATAFSDAITDLKSEGAEKYKDFLEVVDRPVEKGGPAVTPVMVEAMIESDFGPDIAYWLGKNPKESLKIFGMSPVAQARAIFELENKVKAQAAPPKSNAPAPVKPVKGGSAAAQKPVSQMSMSEYAAYRNKQIRGE